MPSRGETFRRPAGNRKYELPSCAEQPRNAWTVNRQESDQFCRFVRGFKAEWPEANQLQYCLAERVFKAHLLLQRLEDRRCFMDGTETTHKRFDKYYIEITDEKHAARWEREYHRWFLPLHRELRELCKILLANGINLTIDGDLTAMFSLDDKDRKALAQYKNDSSSQGTTS